MLVPVTWPPGRAPKVGCTWESFSPDPVFNGIIIVKENYEHSLNISLATTLRCGDFLL